MRASIYFIGDESVGIFSYSYESEIRDIEDDIDREELRSNIKNFYETIEGEKVNLDHVINRLSEKTEIFLQNYCKEHNISTDDFIHNSYRLHKYDYPMKEYWYYKDQCICTSELKLTQGDRR